jgi:hypothetical protein
MYDCVFRIANLTGFFAHDKVPVKKQGSSTHGLGEV